MSTSSSGARRTACAVGLLIGVVGLAAGCSRGSSDDRSDIAPTATPSATIASQDPPVGSRTVVGAAYELSVPGGWEEERRSLGAKGEIARWSEPATDGPAPEAVAVVVDTDPKTSLLQQSYALEQRLREDGTPVTRSSAARSDTKAPAILVQWSETSRGDNQRRAVWQLLVQPPGDASILNIVGYGPAEGFATSEVPKVMGTFRLRG